MREAGWTNFLKLLCAERLLVLQIVWKRTEQASTNTALHDDVTFVHYQILDLNRDITIFDFDFDFIQLFFLDSTLR